jgi:hypothetical protein
MRGNKARNLIVSLLVLVLLAAGGGAAAAGQDFRQDNDLVPYQPPAWFLSGHFVAREVGPRYLFGTVADFAGSLGHPTTWLIESAEQARVEKAAALPEFSLYLEEAAPGGKVYWMFVVMPHQDPQQWFRERWDYHKSKAEGYYGKTLEGLKTAFAQGLAVRSELRFRVEGGQAQVEPPEETILAQGRLKPVFELREGRPLSGASASR